jgi:hypothetical protein
MRTAISFLIMLAACTTEPSADPCDAYAIELTGGGSTFRVGDTKTVIATDLETGAALPPTLTDLAAPNVGVVSIDRASVLAQAAGVTAVEVSVGRCREAVVVQVR